MVKLPRGKYKWRNTYNFMHTTLTKIIPSVGCKMCGHQNKDMIKAIFAKTSIEIGQSVPGAIAWFLENNADTKNCFFLCSVVSENQYF